MTKELREKTDDELVDYLGTTPAGATAEMMLRLKKALDEGSTLARYIIRLTWVLVLLTMALLGLTVVMAWPLIWPR